MNSVLSLLLAPISIFVDHPYLGLLPAALFLVYYLVRRPAAKSLRVPGLVRWSLFSGLCWLAYTIYEFQMQAWSRTVMGAIRVDLVLVAPILLILTVTAIWGCIRFERVARAGVVPPRPLPRPEPGDRTMVIGAALALAGFPVMDLLFWTFPMNTPVLSEKLPMIAVSLGLGFFLARGYPWARWLAGARCALGALLGLFAWESLAPAGPRFSTLRYWLLVGAVFYAGLGFYIAFSQQVRRYSFARRG